MWVLLRASAALAWVRIFERPSSSLQLLATLSSTVLAWLVLSAIASPFLPSKVGAALHSGLSIANARVQTNPFPLRHIHQLERLPSVATVSYFSIASFPCIGATGTLSVNSYGGTGITSWLRAEGAQPDQLDAWSQTPNGLLVGAEAAERCGLHPGLEFSPTDFLSRTEIPLKIVAVLPPGRNGMADRVAYGHYEYFNRMSTGPLRDMALRARVTGTDPAGLNLLAEEIEAAFIAADPPLQASTSSGSESALGRFGQVQSLLWLIMLAIIACTTLVFITVLAHITEQRRPSMALLQTLGFYRSIQLAVILIEYSIIALLAVLIGVVTSRMALALLNPHVSWILGEISIQSWALAWLAPAILVLGVSALAAPLLQLHRLKPMDHLLH